MNENELKYDYTRSGDEYRDEEWINLLTWKKELVRIPIGRTMRDAPYILYHISESTFNYNLQIKSCKFPKEYNDFD